MSQHFKHNRSGSEWTFYNDAEDPESGEPYEIFQELGFTARDGTYISGLPMITRAFDEEIGAWLAELGQLPKLT
jgi:hypothetical protein